MPILKTNYWLHKKKNIFTEFDACKLNFLVQIIRMIKFRHIDGNLKNNSSDAIQCKNFGEEIRQKWVKIHFLIFLKNFPKILIAKLDIFCENLAFLRLVIFLKQICIIRQNFPNFGEKFKTLVKNCHFYYMKICQIFQFFDKIWNFFCCKNWH